MKSHQWLCKVNIFSYRQRIIRINFDFRVTMRKSMCDIIFLIYKKSNFIVNSISLVHTYPKSAKDLYEGNYVQFSKSDIKAWLYSKVAQLRINVFSLTYLFQMHLGNLNVFSGHISRSVASQGKRLISNIYIERKQSLLVFC